MTTSTTCHRCGANVPPGVRFCTSCGADVSGEQANIATAYVPRAGDVRPTMSDTALLDALRHATLGEYEILAELGRGGMATVYLAHDLSLDRQVAIKVMAPALLTGEGMVERFKREARTAAQLSHPHIIPIFAVRESENLVYFVMKFVEGRSLESIIKELGPLPIPMAQSILQQVGGALAYAHRRGVIHRDVKPGNIMIDADGWAVVTDFGIAKVSEARGLTVSGATIGTPAYMSPEQCAAKDIGPASDQYSFGIVAYEMLTGQQPFVGDSIMAIMYLHFNEPPPRLRDVRPDCPVEIEAAVLRMLAKDPAERFSDVDAAAAAIGGAPLAPDDPIRTQLMTLVATSAQAKMLKSVVTPRSPMPASRIRGKTTRVVEPTTGMSLSPPRVSVVVGGYVQLTAGRKSRGGVTLPGDAITWASTDTEVATVDESGLVTAVAPGTAIITATLGTVSATGTVTVTPATRRARRRLIGVLATVLVLGAGAVAAWMLGPWRTAAPAAQPTSAAPDSLSLVPATPPAAPDSAAANRDTAVPPPAAVRPQPVTRRPSTQAPSSAPPPTVVIREPAPDTLVPAMRRRALEVRQEARVAGATDADLAAGDALADDARRLADGGQIPDALARLGEALASWRTAAATARTRAAATAPPPAVNPAPVDPRPQIENTIARYGRALESGDLDAVRRIYPTMPPARARRWRDFFQSVKDLRVALQPSGIQLTDAGSANTTVAATMEFTGPDGRTQRQDDQFVVLLGRAPDGSWLITEIR